MGEEYFIPRGRAVGLQSTRQRAAFREHAVAHDLYQHYPFKMKRASVILTLTYELKLFYFKTQSLARSKHSASRLQKQIS